VVSTSSRLEEQVGGLAQDRSRGRRAAPGLAQCAQKGYRLGLEVQGTDDTADIGAQPEEAHDKWPMSQQVASTNRSVHDSHVRLATTVPIASTAAWLTWNGSGDWDLAGLQCSRASAKSTGIFATCLQAIQEEFRTS